MILTWFSSSIGDSQIGTTLVGKHLGRVGSWGGVGVVGWRSWVGWCGVKGFAIKVGVGGGASQQSTRPFKMFS